MKYRLEGTSSSVNAFLSEIGQPLEVVERTEVPRSPGDRRPLGMEALMYVVVVFSAHLAASVAHDLLHEKIRALAAKVGLRSVQSVDKQGLEDQDDKQKVNADASEKK